MPDSRIEAGTCQLFRGIIWLNFVFKSSVGYSLFFHNHYYVVISGPYLKTNSTEIG
jgi:hypothetical protein